MLLGGRFELQARIGVGGSASVYRALDTQRDDLAAVKVLHPDLTGEERTAERFVREIEVHRRLDHPGIPAYRASSSEGMHWMATDFVEGDCLAALASRGLKPSEVATWGLELCATLGWLHDLGIVHRDVKPDNVMVDRDGRALLLDLGIARTEARITQHGDLMGTPGFMPVEQELDPRDADPRTDLYALGVSLYAVLTLRSGAELAYD
ncbi:MAG: serine/threonine protein kinase, partial [Myxococcales bacterium]|nr:serine/threonine protein kinase [Myxococcales bacterium]